jgi:arylsulfatase A
MQRRDFLSTTAALLATASLPMPAGAATRKPNFIVIFCDDLGYGDVGPNGGRIRTPNLDRMAREGVVLTDFYAAANVCTPSRAGLLTGRYPIRSGLAMGVIMQNDQRGLPRSEVTIAQALKPDYATALIGKWHLGHIEPYWPPTNYGFDLFMGLPYSHDMKPLALYEAQAPGVELTKEDVDFPQLQQRFAERALRFIEQNKDRPFFLDLALSAPHLPSHTHPPFQGQSGHGTYGDVVMEVDSIVGRVIDKVKELGLDRDTLVILTSDNGPWFEGSAGPLRDRKNGAGWDGGYRVPFIARQPGTLPAGRKVNSIAMAIDLLPTFCAMARAPLPAGVELDGRDITAVLTRGAASPHDELILFDNEVVAAIRTQRWKYVVKTHYGTILMPLDLVGYEDLFDVMADPSESYSLAAEHPEVVADMKARITRARTAFKPLRKGIPENLRQMEETARKFLEQQD